VIATKPATVQLEPFQSTRYEVDSDGRIVSVGAGWDTFAVSNGAPQLAADAVIGRPLSEFMVGASTAHLYDALRLRIREGRRVVLPFRCDGPAVRRSMELFMEPAPNGHVRYEAVLRSSSERLPVALLDVETPRDTSLVTLCAWCRRIEVGVRWLEVEEGIRELRLFDVEKVPRITHGICPDCHRMMMDEIAAT
jgi:hypothetical protein